MNNKLKLFILIILPLFFLPMINGEIESLGIFQQHSCIELLQSCSNCTYINISSVIYPNSSQALGQVAMTKIGTKYNYTSCEVSSETGTYIVNGFGDVDGIITVFAYDYEVTPSGSQINSGKSIGLFGSVILMIIISSVFLIIAFKSENNVARISFYCFSGIGFMITILYTVIIMQQTLFGFDSILSGIENFWFVAKILVWIGFLALGIVVLLIMMKAWKIKRGLIDTY